MTFYKRIDLSCIRSSFTHRDPLMETSTELKVGHLKGQELSAMKVLEMK